MEPLRRSILLAWVLLAILLAACDTDAPPEPAPPTATPTQEQPETLYDIRDDVQYIDMMVPHHQLAVDMSRIALEKAQHGELKGLARDIIFAQEDEIRRMMIWRVEIAGSSLTPEPPTRGHGGHNPVFDMPGMDVDLDELAVSDNFDRDFIEAMIPHHESAIGMSQAALPHLKHPALRDFATDVISTQQLEIDRMKRWLEEW